MLALIISANRFSIILYTEMCTSIVHISVYRSPVWGCTQINLSRLLVCLSLGVTADAAVLNCDSSESSQSQRAHKCWHTCQHTYHHTFQHTCLHTYNHTCNHTCPHTCHHTFQHTCQHTCQVDVTCPWFAALCSSNLEDSSFLLNYSSAPQWCSVDLGTIPRHLSGAQMGRDTAFGEVGKSSCVGATLSEEAVPV